MEPLSWPDRLRWQQGDEVSSPLILRLCDALRAAIWRGDLQPADRLPSTRTLAVALGIGRNSVMAAYEHLLAEGYLYARHGSGTFVSTDVPDEFHRVGTSGPDETTPASRPALRVSRMADGMSRFAATLPSRHGQAIVPFRAGIPAVDHFPWSIWTRCLTRRWRAAPQSLACSEDSAGFLPLREEIAAFLRQGRGVGCHADQVIVVSGAQQALDLAARLLLDVGDQVVIEDPGYPGIDGLLRATGAEVIPLPVDAEGVCLPESPVADGCRVALLTPSHNYPLGVTMSLSRRLAWLGWARQRGAWIIEDDYDSDFRFQGRPLTALQGLDVDGRILYVGTFTRALFPGLRLGYLVVPERLIDTARAIRRLSDGGGSVVAQVALADFMRDGHFAAHLRAMRRLYAERCQALEQALSSHLGGLLRVPTVEGGVHLNAFLPPGWDDREMVRVLAKNGITTVALSPYYKSTKVENGIMLGFTCWSEVQLNGAVCHLERVCNSLLSAPPMVR